MRVRRDVAHELISAISTLNGYAETPGALELAIKESARRDEVERDPGAEIHRLVDGYVRRVLGPDVVLDDVVRGVLLKKLDAGEPFDLKEWHEASLELAKETSGQILAFKTKILREHHGKTTETTILFGA